MNAILDVDGLVKRFRTPGRDVLAVDNVSFDLARGETLALVGESGSGKTTVARCVLRLLEPTSGRVLMDGVDMAGLSPRALRAMRRRIQPVFQDPTGSLDPRRTVGAQVADGIVIHGIASGAEAMGHALALLDRVGLPPGSQNRYPHEFSGGQRQRVGIARALSTGPDLIVLDEAVSALDVSVRAQVLGLLLELQAGLGLGYLFISHDLSVVRHCAHRVAVMYAGRLAEIGPTSAVFDDPRHPYTRALLASAKGRRNRHETPPVDGEPPSLLAPPPGCRFHPRCPLAVPDCARTSPGPMEVGAGHIAWCPRQ